MIEKNEQIELMAAVNWELAKGHLRAVSAALGQVRSITRDQDDKYPFQIMDEAIDEFVTKVEDNELLTL